MRSVPDRFRAETPQRSSPCSPEDRPGGSQQTQERHLGGDGDVESPGQKRGRERGEKERAGEKQKI